MPTHATRRTRHFSVCASALASARLAAARDFLVRSAAGNRVLVVGATRGAADDLAREVASRVPATFGIRRFSLVQLAAQSALAALASAGKTSSTWLGTEAVAARVAFEAHVGGALRYFDPVARTPGFSRALARTLQEVRLAGADPADLRRASPAGSDLAGLLERTTESLIEVSSADRAELFRTASRVCRAAPAAQTIVLLDVPMPHAEERAFVEALIAGADALFVTVPLADHDAVEFLRRAGGAIEIVADPGHDDLGCLRRFLFSAEAPPPGRTLDGSLEFFSAPGEGREAVEIARRVLREARAGVRFDEMAILVRSPQHYLGLLDHALHRARIPAWFARGTRRPHPAGRAFLALLACAAEHLAASRFAEYLSFAQVPSPGQRPQAVWAASEDEALVRAQGPPPPAEEGDDPGAAEGVDAVVAGTLRAPWRWESLLVDAAVIGRDAGRWRRRLDGKRQELERQIVEVSRQDGGDDARAAALRQVRDQLGHLEAFALPIIEELAAWPASAPWREWLDRLERLVPRVLRSPSHVLRVLADLRPMGEVGPIGIDEVRRVLSERLLSIESDPPASRYGHVWVGTPEQARGRSFRVVFVPGLAERMFPQKPREDPLLLDLVRDEVDPRLATQKQRLASERLLLQLAAGAASERLYVSYPRIELGESRARVPSFYALDVMRAATGRVPHHEVLESLAREAGDATLAWPAPARPEEAIDEQEHDLAVLRRLLDESDPRIVKGHAHYLLKLNECLRRSVVDRWGRGQRRWSGSDGLTRVQPHTQSALSAQRLSARSYSASALQLFSACPYQFVLSAMFRLRPFEPPEPLQRLDPLTRGSLFHEIQARFLRLLQAGSMLPVTAANVESARTVLDEVADQVGRAAYDELAPAVERVWHDELAALGRDLHAWLDYLARDGEEWLPLYFEFGFGEVPGERDAHSIRDAVVLVERFRLRGAVDLIEEHRQTRVLRVTDHKTGRKPDRIDKVVVGGGAMLQPVLYSMAVEAGLHRAVSHGRLFYCTATGGFHQHPVLLDERSRAAGIEVLEVVERAIEQGFLPRSPTEEACGRCDFRPVCGPDVYRRLRGKPQEALGDLLAIRSRP